jgi:hypothetical protein
MRNRVKPARKKKLAGRGSHKGILFVRTAMAGLLVLYQHA